MHTIRYAHCEGFTDLCFTDTGKFLTTGEDGDVRIWEGFDDLDNTSIRVGDKCFAIGYKGGKIYVADELNELKKYDLETNEFQGVITSFTLPITCVSINKSNTFLVCGSSDFEIHLVELSTLKVTSFTGHDAPILSICYDPFEKYFVSASCDGTARFWSVQTLVTVKTLSDLHSKSNDFIDSESSCTIAWHKDGGLIAVPCKKEIHFYERETWLCKFKIALNAENTSDAFNSSIVCFSPDGKFVLATTNTQMVFIHSIINKSLVFKYSYTKKSKICSLAWNPLNKSEIIFCDMKGQMGQIKANIKDQTSETSQEKEAEDLPMDDLLNLLESDEKSNDSTESTIKRPSKKDMKSPLKKRKRLSDEDEEEEKDSVKTSSKDKDLSEEEDEMVSLEKLKEKTLNDVKKDIMSMEYDENGENDDMTGVNVSKKKEVMQQVPAFKQQTPFQSSSTPLSLPERYMVWNSVGLITQFNKEGDESIDIEFHNVSLHHTIHIKNQYGYTMGDMSKEAVVLASPGKSSNSDDSEENEFEFVSATGSTNSHSKLTCIMLNSCDNTKEWSIEMLKKEYIRCVCVSKMFVVCATSRKFLRIYCLAGTQKEIICIAGSPICIAAYDNRVFVAHSNGPTLEYSIYFLEDSSREAEHGQLAISDNAKLEWLGFSDEGNPYYYDSNGFLFTKCLTISKSNTWTPLSHLRATLTRKSDNYWLIGITERTQMLKTIICRGAKHPNVLPRPTLCVISVNLPLTDPDSEKTVLEQEYWKNRHFMLNIKNYECSSGNIEMDDEELEEKVDKFENNCRGTLMKLYMLACKNGKEQRAYEIASIMDADSIQLAIKYATKSRSLVLAQNLNLLAEKKAEIEQKKREYEEAVEEEKQVSYNTFRSATHTKTRTTTIEQDENNSEEILIDETSSTLTSTKKATQHNDTQLTITNTIDDSFKSCITPTSIPLTATRINPFAKSGLSAKTKLTPLNDSSKSIINEIEEKVQKQSASKDKDAWKPTPTRKLIKSKASNTPTGTLNSFFSKE